MSYRCEICADVAPPGQPMIRHVVERHRPQTPWGGAGTEIAKEIAVCSACARDLRMRENLPTLFAAHSFTRVARLEEKRLRKATRKAVERAALRESRKSLFPTLREQRAAEKLEVRLEREQLRLLEEKVGPIELEAPTSSSIFG